MNFNFSELAEAALVSKQRENEKDERAAKEREQIAVNNAKRHNAMRRSATIPAQSDRRNSINVNQRKRRSNKPHDIRIALQALQMADEEIMQVGFSNADYGLKRMATAVQQRNKPWLRRFGDSLDESMVVHPPLTVFEQAAIDAANSKSIVRLPVAPQRKQPMDSSRLVAFKDDRCRSNECFFCRGAVPVGAEMVECRSCPMICHLRCCSDIHKYIKKPKEVTTTTATTTTMSKQAVDYDDDNNDDDYNTATTTAGEDTFPSARGHITSTVSFNPFRTTTAADDDDDDDYHPSVRTLAKFSVASFHLDIPPDIDSHIDIEELLKQKQEEVAAANSLKTKKSTAGASTAASRTQSESSIQRLGASTSSNNSTRSSSLNASHQQQQQQQPQQQQLQQEQQQQQQQQLHRAASSRRLKSFTSSRQQRPQRNALLKLQLPHSPHSPLLSPLTTTATTAATTATAMSNSPKGKFVFIGGKLRPVAIAATFAQRVAKAATATTAAAAAAVNPHWYLTSRDVEWSCLFCLQEVEHQNVVQEENYQQSLSSYRRQSSAIRIQSCWRRARWRHRYLTARRGAVLLQRVLRMRELARRDELEKANERHPYRIRIHDVLLFVRDTDNATVATATTTTTSTTAATVAAFNNSSNNNSNKNSNNSNNIDNNNNNRNKNKRISSAQQLQPTPPFPLLPYPRIIGEMASMGFDKLFGEFKVSDPQVEEKDLEMVELIAAGHQDTPTFAKTFRGMQHVQSGSVFITVTVHELAVFDPRAAVRSSSEQQLSSAAATAVASSSTNRRPVQIARYDLQLKSQGKPSRLRSSYLEKLGYHLDKSELELLLNRYRVATFVSPKPYILIPYCRANCEVKITVSQVTDWPKAVIIGQSVYNVKRFIQRKRFLSLSQGLSPCFYFDLPASEDGCRLNLMLPRTNESAAGSGGDGGLDGGNTIASSSSSSIVGIGSGVDNSGSSGAVIMSRSFGRRSSDLSGQYSASGGSSSNSSSVVAATAGAVRARSRGRELHVAKAVNNARNNSNNSGGEINAKRNKLIAEYSSGAVTWTLMPMGYSESNEAGFMMQLNHETIDSTKKKCWCILIDKILTIFSVVKESTKTKHTVDIRTAYISLLEHDVVKVKAPVETLFLHCYSQKEHEKWFRKMYTQSMSHSVQPFHLYNRRKGAVAKPTEAEIEATMQGLMEGQYARVKPSAAAAGGRFAAATAAGGSSRMNYISRTGPMRTMTRSSYEEVELLDMQIQSFLEEMRTTYVENQAKVVDFRNPDDYSKQHKTASDYLDTLVSAVTSSLHRF